MSRDDIVNKLWKYCHALKDDGMSYGDYLEQLTYLRFLKMADDRTQASYDPPSVIPRKYSWRCVIKKDSDQLFEHYRHTRDALGKGKGRLGLIFSKDQNKLQDPAKLCRLLVDLFDKENWSVMGADVKGDACEELVEKNAQDTKSGAGHYFTPRPLIQTIVDAVGSEPGESIAEPDGRFDPALANPPLDKKSSNTIFGEIVIQIDTNLKRAERLRQSILGLAFAGDLASSPMQAAL